MKREPTKADYRLALSIAAAWRIGGAIGQRGAALPVLALSRGGQKKVAEVHTLGEPGALPGPATENETASADRGDG